MLTVFQESHASSRHTPEYLGVQSIFRHFRCVQNQMMCQLRGFQTPDENIGARGSDAGDLVLREETGHYARSRR